jgi:hypothetical protein
MRTNNLSLLQSLACLQCRHSYSFLVVLSYARKGNRQVISKFIIPLSAYLAALLVFYCILFPFLYGGKKYTLTGYIKNLIVGYPYPLFHYLCFLLLSHYWSGLASQYYTHYYYCYLPIVLLNVLYPGILSLHFSLIPFFAPLIIRTTLANGLLPIGPGLRFACKK